ncbi:MAG: DUF4256 domain-containing protein [Bacteroidetes bacterium]|nr:DUF4256 domain-containing protein [Bacteroidota bacterium]MBS1740138.1 DUF4256 domain-containing protein [Bacteroidota bacterium]
MIKPQLSESEIEGLLKVLKARFDKNKHRHQGIEWKEVEARLVMQPTKLWSINEMEGTGGEPDVVVFDPKDKMFVFCDCASESPKGRRSICYDHEALASRKEHKPKNSAVNMAEEMGIELLDEFQYGQLQSLEQVDSKTSSWLKSPESVRKQGGAIFGDFRFGRVFYYHNGAESYYAGRGFRGLLRV